MEFFTCTEDPGDRMGVSSFCDNVIVVLTSVNASDRPCEISMTRGTARRLALHVLAIVEDPQTAGATIGELWVHDGCEDETVLIAGEVTADDVRSVLLAYPDATRFASALYAAAQEAEMYVIDARDSSTASTVDAMTKRMFALAMAHAVLSPDCTELVTAAHWIATGELPAPQAKRRVC